MAEYEISREHMIQLMHRDVRLMLSFYLGDEITLEIPDMHLEIWDELVALLDRVNKPDFLVGHLKKLLAIPRDHSKTTLIKLAVVLFMRYSKLAFTAYVSNTAPAAHNAILDVINWLMSEEDQKLWGPAELTRRSSNEQLYQLRIGVPGAKTTKLITLKGFGWGTQIRGTVIDNKRPDLLIYDDIESRETVESELQQSRLDAWATGTGLKAMAARGVAIFIGNMIGKTSLLARLARDPKKEWNPTVLGAIVKLSNGDLVPLWPGKHSLESLISEYQTYRGLGLGHIWEAEMMNLTSDELFTELLDDAWTPEMPTPDMIESGFICLDPAFGEKSWHDYSAISVHVKLKPEFSMSTQPELRPILASVYKDKVDHTRLLELMLEHTYTWGITTWVIESIAAQRLLIPLFHNLLAAMNLPPNLIVILPITGGKKSKASRIVAFRSAVKHTSYGISSHLIDFKAKLQGYSPLSTEDDDDLDSAAYGTIVWQEHGVTINSRLAGGQVLGMLMEHTDAQAISYSGL